jgi:hypothetical protein
VQFQRVFSAKESLLHRQAGEANRLIATIWAEAQRRITVKTTAVLKYLLNCFLLIIPALILNLLWATRLPPMWQFEFFWKNIPPAITYGENISRTLVNVLPVFMPLHVSTKRQKTGLVIYIMGALSYLLVWILMVYFPQSTWSTSLIGSTATAWTSLLWLIGIGLIGDSLYFPIPYRSWVYILLSVVFATFHTVHAGIVYLRIP